MRAIYILLFTLVFSPAFSQIPQWFDLDDITVRRNMSTINVYGVDTSVGSLAINRDTNGVASFCVLLGDSATFYRCTHISKDSTWTSTNVPNLDGGGYSPWDSLSGNVFLKQITDKVGIGIDSPTAKLQVKQSTVNTYPVIIGDSLTAPLTTVTGLRMLYRPIFGGAVNYPTLIFGGWINGTPFGLPNSIPSLSPDSIGAGGLLLAHNSKLIGSYATNSQGGVAMLGGKLNTSRKSEFSSILTGENNYIDSSKNSVIIGGYNNTLSNSLENTLLGATNSYLDSVRGCVVTGFNDTIIGNRITYIFSAGGNNDVYSNTISSGNNITTIKLSNNNRVTGNNISGATSLLTGGIQFCNLFDNNQIIGNALTGEDTYIWDVHALENCQVDSNLLSGDNSSLDMLVLANFDSVTNNILSGNGSFIRDVFTYANSSVNRNTLTANSYIRRINLSNGIVSNNSLGANIFGFGNFFEDISIYNGSITNGSNISVQNVGLWNMDLDLTGRTTDLDGYYGFGGDVNINGSVKITDGTQADGYVFTSDANGDGTWQDPTAYGEMGFGDSTRTIALTQNVFSVVTNTANDLWSTAAVDLHNVTYSGDSLIIDSAGTYQVNIQLSMDGTSGSVIRLGVFLNGVLACSCTGYQELLNNRILQLTYINIDALNAGDVLQVVITNTANNDDVDAIGGKLMVNKIR